MRRFLSPAARLFVRDPFVQGTFFLSLTVTMIVFGVLLWLLPRQENIVLRYNILFGIDLLGPWYQALMGPIAEAMLIGINTLVGLFIWRRDRVLSYILGSGTLITAVIIAVSSGLILYLNR